MRNFADIVDRRVRGHRDFEGLLNCQFGDVQEIELEDSVLKQKGEELFNIIFGVDEITGLPSGDLAMFMNKNTSPEVRQYITENLMRDVSSAAAPAVSAKNFKDLDDDMIAQLSRGSSESLGSYRDRMIEFVKSQQSKPSEDGQS